MNSSFANDIPFHGPFTARDAQTVGISRQSLMRRVNAGQLTRLRRGVYAPTENVAPIDRIRGGLLTAPQGSVVAFEAAAILHNMPLPHSHGLKRVDLYVPDGTPHGGGRPASEVRLHYVELPLEQIVSVNNIAVTSIARTAVDISCSQPFVRALIPLDHALRAGVGISALYDARYAASGRRGVAILNRALNHCSPLAESPMESISRGVFIDAELPAPVLQAALVGQSGQRYRVDFHWPEFDLIGEADGIMKYVTDSTAFRREKFREDDLRQTGYWIVRWTWDELIVSPQIVIARLKARMHASANARRLP